MPHASAPSKPAHHTCQLLHTALHPILVCSICWCTIHWYVLMQAQLEDILLSGIRKVENNWVATYASAPHLPLYSICFCTQDIVMPTTCAGAIHLALYALHLQSTTRCHSIIIACMLKHPKSRGASLIIPASAASVLCHCICLCDTPASWPHYPIQVPCHPTTPASALCIPVHYICPSQIFYTLCQCTIQAC